MAEKSVKENSTLVKGFHLLNPGKLEKALDKLGEGATEEQVLAAYDKLGGAIRKEGRKVAMGTFYDFVNKEPRKDVNYEVLTEENFEDQMVLVRKPVKKKEDGKTDLKSKLAKVKKAEEVNPDQEEAPAEAGQAGEEEGVKPKKAKAKKAE